MQMVLLDFCDLDRLRVALLLLDLVSTFGSKYY
jgi:hypothetical protein